MTKDFGTSKIFRSNFLAVVLQNNIANYDVKIFNRFYLSQILRG